MKQLLNRIRPPNWNLGNIVYKIILAPIVRWLNRRRILHRWKVLPARIVICGCQRSGTTLMNEMMRSYKDVSVLAHEEPALRCPYLMLTSKYVVTKYPEDCLKLSEIKATFGDPYIIFLLRDPRDVIVSRHYKNPNRYWVDFKKWKEAVEHYEQFDSSRKVVVRYEELVDNPNMVQELVANIVGLRIRYPFSEFYQHVKSKHPDIKALGGVRPVDSSNKFKYLNLENYARIKEQLIAHPDMSEWLIRYGYQESEVWEQQFQD